MAPVRNLGRELINAPGRTICDVRYSPKATNIHFRATCRDVQKADISIRTTSICGDD